MVPRISLIVDFKIGELTQVPGRSRIKAVLYSNRVSIQSLSIMQLKLTRLVQNRIFQIACLCLALPAAADPQNKEIITWVTPFDAGNAHADTIRLINKAKKTIRVSMYAFTDEIIAGALIQARCRKVDVQVILDESQAKGQYEIPVITELKNAGVPLKIGNSPDGQALLHMKMLTVDGIYTLSGSWNFSHSASKQFNNLDIIRSKTRAQMFEMYWQKIWDSIP